jgi:hypothetical protein
LEEALRALFHDRERVEFVVMTASASPYYVQFRFESSPELLSAEATGNAYLAPADALSIEQHARLQALGWRPSRARDDLQCVGLSDWGPYGWCSGNWWTEFRVRSESDLDCAADLAVPTLDEVYGAHCGLIVRTAVDSGAL